MQKEHGSGTYMGSQHALPTSGDRARCSQTGWNTALECLPRNKSRAITRCAQTDLATQSNTQEPRMHTLLLRSRQERPVIDH